MSIGDKLFGSDAMIVKKEYVMDIPLTPCVYEGELFSLGKLVSCWTNNKEEADMKNNLMKLAKEVRSSEFKHLTDQEFAIFCESFYDNFHSLNKNEGKIQYILDNEIKNFS